MIRWAMAAAAILAAGATGVTPIGDGMGGDGVETPIPLPSGHQALFLDTITNAAGGAGLTYRFRFVAPWIAEGADFETVSADMAYLCEAYALPRIADIGPQPAQIVVSFTEKPLEFGQTAHDVIQFFEAYRPDGATCVWEFF